MKIIEIFYGAAGIVYKPDAAIGYEGDHRAAELQIHPPELPEVSFYRLDWRLPDGTLYSTEDLHGSGGVIQYPIPAGLTRTKGFLTAQLKAFRWDGSELLMQAGTPHIRLFLGASVPGGEAPPEELQEPLAYAVAQALEAGRRANTAADKLSRLSFSVENGNLILEVPDDDV